MNYRTIACLALLCGASALTACSGGGGNNNAGANDSAPAANASAISRPSRQMTADQLIGTRWELRGDSCPGFARVEFRADAIVTPTQTIPVTYEPNTSSTGLTLTPGAGSGIDGILTVRHMGQSNIMISMPPNARTCDFQPLR